MAEVYSDKFCRNLGFISEDEQATLRRSAVAIAGVGGVGGLLGERLVRLGVGRLRITDPEDFEATNLNRQYACSASNLRRNKALVIAEQLREINPEATIEHGEEAIKTQDDANRFVAGSHVVVDGMDFGLFKESVFLQRAARRSGLYYMFASAVGFGALLLAFDPNGLTLEEYNGFDRDTDPDDIDGGGIPLDRICPIVPKYAEAMEAGIVEEIMTGARAAPTNCIGVGLASLLVANEVMNVLLGKRDIAAAPRYTFVDLLDRQFVTGTVE